MKCILCLRFSISIICKSCQLKRLRPDIREYQVAKVRVYSFYRYSEIEPLLKSKYSIFGSSIYKILAKNSLRIFAKEFKFDKRVISIGIDDNPERGFSHTAILNRALKSKYIEPKYNRLRASNPVKYAGKSKEFRAKNRRDFQYFKAKELEAILVDDIITYGFTIKEAIETLRAFDVEPLFGLILANVKSN